MPSTLISSQILLLSFLCFSLCGASEASSELQFDMELPTFHCLGYRWLLDGDSNANASVEVEYKSASSQKWLKALPLHRVEPEAMESLQPKAGQILFAGSILFLQPDTKYDVRLTLNDPDNTQAIVKTLSQQTLSESLNHKALRTFYVQAPEVADANTLSGNGSKDDPWSNFDQACKQLRAGDTLILLPGSYVSNGYLKLNGSAEHPIVIRGSQQDKVIINGGADKTGLELSGSHYVQVENLTITDSFWALRVISATHLVIQDCFFDGIGTGIFGDSNKSKRLIIRNNHIKGVLPFPYSKDTKTTYTGELRGVDIAGSAHIVCNNLVHGFRDGIDVRGDAPIMGVDIHNNDIFDCYDDAMELDGTDQNTRAFYNRITNTGSGVSLQPIHGGPAYAVRNSFYNLRGETYKIHLSPTGAPHRTSGAYLLHNTVVRSGPCMRVWSDEGPGHYFTFYNNLYLGTGGPIEITCPMKFTKMDHNGYFHDGKFKHFSYWNSVNYPSIEDFSQATGLEKNGISQIISGNIIKDLDSLPNRDVSQSSRLLELSKSSPAIDRGIVLPSINNDFSGKAPDLGALEEGSPAPHYGIIHKP